ncbi:MAG TPA: MFS transporter [Gemmatimonas sp.]
MVLLLAAGAGLSVAALYYCQPMLGAVAFDLGTSARSIGLVPMMTQLGYAAGILLLAPLGDRIDRRQLILIKSVVLATALMVAGNSYSIAPLLAASLVIGLSATLAQDILPATATLAPESHRGRIVGMVMTGLLLGILLSRVISGVVAEQFGWRVMFMAAAASIALLGMAMYRSLPAFAVTTQLDYLSLLRSLGALARRHAPLRQAALAQGLLSVGFSAFWSTLAVMLHAAPFHLGSAAAGAFGLAGAVGALAAPIAGRVADRRGPEHMTRVGAAMAVIGFALMAAMPVLSIGAQLVLLGVSAVLFDLGVQSTLVSHQTLVYSLEPEARSRLNAVLITGMFVGMALGAALGSVLFSQWGWQAVTALATTTSVMALLVRLGRSRF